MSASTTVKTIGEIAYEAFERTPLGTTTFHQAWELAAQAVVEEHGRRTEAARVAGAEGAAVDSLKELQQSFESQLASLERRIDVRLKRVGV